MSAPDDETLRAYAPAGLCMMGVEESGEDSTCGAPATHKLTGPHDYDPDHWYCEAHGREIHAGIKYNHRWQLSPLPGVAESVALRAEVLRLRERVEIAEAERDALRALRDGCPEAPTDAELDAAAREGGLWIGTRPHKQFPCGRERAVMTAVLCAGTRYSTGHHYDEDRPATRWYYVAPDGRIGAQRRPCAWPEVAR